jgi:energy-coupling factor transporter ATP-binding protein EcfA2
MTKIAKATTGMPFTMEEFAYKDMQYIVKRVSDKKKKRDAVILYTGHEGTGKTTLACQHAKFVAKKQNLPFSLKNFYFTPRHIYDAIQEAKEPAGTPFIYDEGVTGLMARMGNSKDAIKLHIMFSTCRSKRYPIFICIPRFRELPDWMAMDRSIALYSVYTRSVGEEPEQPGYYVGYDNYNKNKLWVLEKARQFLDVKKLVRTTREGEFSAWPFGRSEEDIPFSYDDYEEYKREKLREEQVPVKQINDLKIICENLHKVGYSYNEIGKLIGKDQSVVRRHLKVGMFTPVVMVPKLFTSPSGKAGGEKTVEVSEDKK